MNESIIKMAFRRGVTKKQKRIIFLVMLACVLQPIEIGATWSPFAIVGWACDGVRLKVVQHPLLSVGFGLVGLGIFSFFAIKGFVTRDDKKKPVIEQKQDLDEKCEEKPEIKQKQDLDDEKSLDELFQRFGVKKPEEVLKPQNERKKPNGDEKQQIDDHLDKFRELYATGKTPSKAFYQLTRALQVAGIKSFSDDICGIGEEGNKEFDEKSDYAYLAKELDANRTTVESFFASYMGRSGVKQEKIDEMQGAQSLLRYYYKIHLMPGGAEQPKKELDVAKKAIAFVLDGAEAAQIISDVMDLYIRDTEFAASVHAIKVRRTPTLAADADENKSLDENESIAPFMVIYPRVAGGCAQNAINILHKKLSFKKENSSYKTPRCNTLFDSQKPGLFYAMGDGQHKQNKTYVSAWLTGDKIHFKHWNNLELKPT